MRTKTITFKVPESPWCKDLEEIRIRRNLPSIHVAAREVLLSYLTITNNKTGSSSPKDAIALQKVEQELLSIRADLRHLTLELRELTAAVSGLIQLQAALSELMLVNIANTDPDQTATVIANLVEASF